jgi:hypothetical protein
LNPLSNHWGDKLKLPFELKNELTKLKQRLKYDEDNPTKASMDAIIKP